jgi:SAM-dependent methyltransferase
VNVTEAYSAAAAGWGDGPMRVYGKLATELVARSPIPLRGCRVLDLGAGTGAATRALDGARVIAVDRAEWMLRMERDERPPSATADALALPFASGTFGAVVAAFCLNHLADPAAGVREAGRVAPLLLASTYAPDDDHPVKRAVDTALAEVGFVIPDWYTAVKASMAGWGTVDGATEIVERAGLEPVLVEHARIPFPDLSRMDLVRWRLGLAHCSAFASTLDVSERALELLPECSGPLVRSVIFIVARGR